METAEYEPLQTKRINLETFLVEWKLEEIRKSFRDPDALKPS